MATLQQINTATKYVTTIQNIIGGLRARATGNVWYAAVQVADGLALYRPDITKLNNFWTGLSAGAKTSLNTLIGTLGYDSAEFDTARNGLTGTIATDIDAVTTANSSVKGQASDSPSTYTALVNAVATAVTDINAITLVTTASF